MGLCVASYGRVAASEHIGSDGSTSTLVGNDRFRKPLVALPVVVNAELLTLTPATHDA
jgi:hypothetical protein